MRNLIARPVLLCLLLASALAGCNRDASAEKNENEQTAKAASGEPATPGAAEASPDRVVVYYFHATRRCRTCLGIQSVIEKTVKDQFAAETAAKSLVLQAVNIDEPQNKHFVKEFDISFSSMVVAAKAGDKTVKWENCDKIWQLARDPLALSGYADERIRASLKLLEKK